MIRTIPSALITTLLAVEFFASPTPASGQVDTVWVRKYNGPGNGEDRAAAVAVDGYGNVCVTGTSLGSGALLDYVTIKYHSDGETAWVRRYNGTASGADQASAIAVDGLGNVYVTGHSQGIGGGLDFLTLKYAPDGEVLWAREYNGPASGEDKAFALVVDGPGNAYVTGKSQGDGTSDDYATVKYHPGGDTAWVRRYNGEANGPDQALAIAVDDSHNVYVAGFSWGGLTSYDHVTVKYDSAGTQLWTRRYDGPASGEDRAVALAVDHGGNAVVGGYSEGVGTLRDYVVIRYYPDGDTCWIRRYDGPASDRDEAKALAIDDSGNVCVTGFSWDSGTNLDFATIRYLPSGDTAWVRRYNGPANGGDYAEAIAVDIFGDVWVTGASDGGSTNQDYVTIMYHRDGSTVWISRYDGEASADDGASAIKVDVSGNVYVAGYSWGSGTSYDYATIKYRTVQQMPCLSWLGLMLLMLLLAAVSLKMLRS
jgi:hypothetical protein